MLSKLKDWKATTAHFASCWGILRETRRLVSQRDLGQMCRSSVLWGWLSVEIHPQPSR